MVDNQIITKNVDMASLFNQLFQSVFVRSDNDTPDSVSDRCVDSGSPSPSGLKFSEEGIFSLLLKIDTKKSGGPDNIPNAFLKRYAEWVSKYLLVIFETSLSQYCVPNDWHCSRGIPVFKSGERHSMNNYRPISLTCTCCKIMEHALSKYLYNYLESEGTFFQKPARISAEVVYGYAAERMCSRLC